VNEVIIDREDNNNLNTHIIFLMQEYWEISQLYCVIKGGELTMLVKKMLISNQTNITLIANTTMYTYPDSRTNEYM
jgi:hypothetical protein